MVLIDRKQISMVLTWREKSLSHIIFYYWLKQNQRVVVNGIQKGNQVDILTSTEHY